MTESQKKKREVVIHQRWAILTTILSFLFVIFTGCDYARMKEQEALQTYRTQIPEMPERTIPITGGLQSLRGVDPETLRNPLSFSQDSIHLGRLAYSYYCIVCHGPKGDGNGTVGQSFAPLPTDLRSSDVQTQSDGKLFYTITFGLKRHPPLGFMIAESDRWAIVHYVRSLSKRTESLRPKSESRSPGS